MSPHDRAHDVKLLLIADREAEKLTPVRMTDLGWKERSDLQRWLSQHPDLIEPDLLLMTTELHEWTGGRSGSRVDDRLDLLFLDAQGHPLVVELKRGKAPDRTESQALLYAAYCDLLSTDALVNCYAKTHGVDPSEAQTKINDHAASLAENQPGQVRVRLVAEDFPEAVTHPVLFLREIGSGSPDKSQHFDIGCIKLTAYQLPDGANVISAQPIIPIPETERYQVLARERQANEEASRSARTTKALAVVVLQRAGVIDPGTVLHVHQAGFSKNQWKGIEKLIDDQPDWGKLEWTGATNLQRAVRQISTEEPKSLAAASDALCAQAGVEPGCDVTSAWRVGETGKTISELADKARSGADLDGSVFASETLDGPSAAHREDSESAS